MAQLSLFFIGLLVGIFVTTLVLSIYGDSELNERVHNIRKARLAIAKMALEIQIRKLILRGKDRGYVLNIGVKDK